MSKGSGIFKKRMLVHCIPFVLNYLYYLAVYIIPGRPKEIQILVYGYDIKNLMHSNSFYLDQIIIQWIGFILFGAYLIYAYIMVKKFEKTIKDFFSDAERISLYWIRTCMVIGLIILILVSFLNALIDFFPVALQEKNITTYITAVASLVCVFTIAVFFVTQPDIFNKIQLMNKALNPENDKKVPNNEKTSLPKYEKHRLPEEEEKKLIKTLLLHMDEKKSYLNDSLTLTQLANEITMNPLQLSMILNIHLQQNFFSFINSYRIKEAMKRIQDPTKNNQSIITIAYDVGFNSKSTFNTMFKKITGKTPSEYKKEHTTKKH